MNKNITMRVVSQTTQLINKNKLVLKTPKGVFLLIFHYNIGINKIIKFNFKINMKN